MKAKRLERFTENVSLRRNERLETMEACGLFLIIFRRKPGNDTAYRRFPFKNNYRVELKGEA